MAIPTWKMFPPLWRAGTRSSSSRPKTCPTRRTVFVEVLLEAGLAARGRQVWSTGSARKWASTWSRHPGRALAISFTGSTETGRGSARSVRTHAQATVARDGREERPDRHAGRQHGAGPGRRVLGRVRDDRTALHRHVPPPTSRTSRTEFLDGAYQACELGPAPRATGLEAQTDVGPLINEAALEKVESGYAADSPLNGGEVVLGGSAAASGPVLDDGWLLPTHGGPRRASQPGIHAWRSRRSLVPS